MPALDIGENVAGGNGEDGFALDLRGEADISMNVASHNAGAGFFFTRHLFLRLRGNAAVANRGFGFAFRDGGGPDLRGSLIHGNRLGGILLVEVAPSLTDIRRNSISGNGATDNCGLVNATTEVLILGENFWGAPDGPGPDPADTLCDVAPAATFLEAVARDPYDTPVTVGR